MSLLLHGLLPNPSFRTYFRLSISSFVQTLLHSTNIVVSTPLTENMPGPSATKPGDMSVSSKDLVAIVSKTPFLFLSFYAMNGKSVEVDNTDAEGRLVLSDAIYYTVTEYTPHTLIDVATLTG